MNKLYNLLKKLIGRIKDKIADWFMVYAGAYTPLGMVVWFFTYEYLKGGIYWAGIIIGTIMIFAGLIALFVSWRLVKQEQLEEKSQRKQDNEKFMILIKEIRSLRKDLMRRSDR